MSKNIVSVSGISLKYNPTISEIEGKNICPISFEKGQRLLRKTLANHVQPRYWDIINEEGFFFCRTKDCSVVYFNNEKKLYFGFEDVRSIVMHKMPIGTENRPVCYCKNVLESRIMDELLVQKCCDSIIDIQQFTEANTGKDCVITNPTGRCCGKQIKEILEWAKSERLEISSPLIEEAMSCCTTIDDVTDNTYENLLKAKD